MKGVFMSKKAVLILIAAVFALFLLFGVFFGQEPEVEIEDVELVFDNFDTNNRKSVGDGAWYAYASGNGAFVANRGNVRVTDSNGVQIDESAMNATVSDGTLNVILDATEPAGIFWAAIERPFFADRREVDLRGLKSILVKGEFSGAIYITLLTGAYDMASNPMWSWRIADHSRNIGTTRWTLNTNETVMGGNWGPDIPTPVDLETALSQAIGFGIALHTVENDFAEFSIDDIRLVFDGKKVPAEFR